MVAIKITMVQEWLSAKARSAVAAASSSWSVVSFFFILLTLGAFFSARWFSNSFLASSTTHKLPTLICPANLTTAATCSATTITNPLPLNQTSSSSSSSSPFLTCPSYFRWIHEDLSPWNSTGITQEAVERAATRANFRLVVLDGTPYVEHYHGAFQTRDVFTLWGILQLLRRYPGRVPDLDLVFNCDDMPVVRSADYSAPNSSSPPPLFRYCKDDQTLDIVFPDWSFWGWPEINIKPWESLLEEMNEMNKRVKWADREPYAYWKGNPWVSDARRQLLKCNVSKDKDWNARIYTQDWDREVKRGFKESNLASQCRHKYKIYVEGRAWSVSQKYILACDSPTLRMATRYVDFMSRGLTPGLDYWPIRADDDKCRSIKFAVDWGNAHQQEAQRIGQSGSRYVQQHVRMDYVYDYMLHLLTEYAKLLKYKPSKPEKAVEICLQSMACPSQGRQKSFMIESMVTSPHDSPPCSMPPPFNSSELEWLLGRKASSTEKVQKWEEEEWKNKNRS